MLHILKGMIFHFLLGELCDEPVSLVATDGESERRSCNGPAEDGTVAVVGLNGKFGANPSTNGNVTCDASDGE